MATRCTPEQLAEALTIWSLETNFNQWQFSEIEDTNGLTPLDLFLSTVRIFLEGFIEKLKTVCDDYKQGILLSKQNFIDYLKHHCFLLAESNGCFDLILTCAFVSHEVYKITFYFQCFHFSRAAYKLLAKILEDRFVDMFNTDSGWEELMAYCRKIHSAVLPSRENRPSDYDNDDECPESYEDPNVKCRTFRRDPAPKEQLSEGRQINKEGVDSGDPGTSQRFGLPISKELADANFIESKDTVCASKDEYSDEDNKSINSNQKEAKRGQEGLESDNSNPDSKNIEMTEESETDSSDIEALSDEEGSDDSDGNFEATGCPIDVEMILNLRNVLKDMLRKQEELEAMSNENDISNENTEDNLSESSDDESLSDDSVYWEFETMKRSVLCKRITDSEEHLRDVLNRLAMIKRKVDPDIIPSNEYNIPISDDEDIQELEKRVTKPNFSESEIGLEEEEEVESLKREICDQKNEKLDELSEKRVSPEDKTDGEIFQNVIDIFGPPDDEDQCEICDGRILPFKNKWIEEFHSKFPGNVSDFLIPVTLRNPYEEQ